MRLVDKQISSNSGINGREYYSFGPAEMLRPKELWHESKKTLYHIIVKLKYYNN